MKLTLKTLTLSLLALLLVAGLSAQTAPVSTTLSAVIADTTANVIALTSATNVLAQGFLYVDGEVMQVTGSYVSGTLIPVRRGASSTRATPHLNLATVYVTLPGIQSRLALRDYDPWGACGNIPGSTTLARSNELILPVINILTGDQFDCVTGASGAPQWTRIKVGTSLAAVTTNKPYTAFTTLSSPNAIATTSVTDVAGTIWFSQLYVPYSATLTGACVLNGATVGTDKWIVALYNSNGVLVANSATAGTTTATASKYQCIAFAATVTVYGPGTYYAALQGNGTTDNFQAYATGGAPTNYGTQSQTGTFGTVAAMTTPTVTFTTAKGPLMMVY
jgi:hypothetical protein